MQQKKSIKYLTIMLPDITYAKVLGQTKRVKLCEDQMTGKTHLNAIGTQNKMFC